MHVAGKRSCFTFRENRKKMPNRYHWISALLWAICLLGPEAVFSACDSFSQRKVFGVEETWELIDKSNPAKVNFAHACNKLMTCYSSEGAIKPACDRAYKKDLKNACAEGTSSSKLFGRCLETANKAVGFVTDEGRSTYRKMQRRTRSAKRKKERKTQTQARSDERRNERRSDRLKETASQIK